MRPAYSVRIGLFNHGAASGGTTSRSVGMHGMRITRRAVVSTLASVGLLVAAIAPASAHVGLKADTTAAGSTAIVSFGFSHGCGDSPTTSLAIQIPDEFLSVNPVFAPGWDIEIEKEALATPVAGGHGEQITERTTTIIFTADEAIEDGIYATVSLRLTLPEDATDETFYFPVVQTCEVGETAWIEIPQDGEDEDDLESPAPAITITEPESDNGH
jgi:uncharacterized protein YcnI